MFSFTQSHHRRSLRLKGYDYSQAGAYFVTVCVYNRECLLGNVLDGEVVLNRHGEISKEEWLRSRMIRKEMEFDEFVIMPNHVHGIVIRRDSLDDVGATGHCDFAGATGRSPLQTTRGPGKRSLGSFAGGFKSAVAKRINLERGTPGEPVWQHNYYEHVIRDDEELCRVRQYIVDNPIQWDQDRENPVGVSRKPIERWQV